MGAVLLVDADLSIGSVVRTHLVEIDAAYVDAFACKEVRNGKGGAGIIVIYLVAHKDKYLSFGMSCMEILQDRHGALGIIGEESVGSIFVCLLEGFCGIGAQKGAAVAAKEAVVVAAAVENKTSGSPNP